ncbi:MAG: F0F1 ATP synthase subunit epsilon [Clostridia bacterium]|jgi:F-type H+-transporting ATPase subunit epsilon|nr:F0F1 ATP synthase subunit epsilon [Clostridia bacterium]
MTSFPLTISSPDGDLYRGDASKLIVRGTEGELAVLAGHIPFVTAVAEGRCVVEDAAGIRKTGTVKSGLLTVRQDRVTLLTTGLTWNE